MPWNDDRWKDGYDAWKLREPDYDDDYDPVLDCEHEDYDIDVCTGRASCNCCDHRWWLDAEEIDRELDRQSRYQEDMEREKRRQWWRDIWASVRSFLRWRRKSSRIDTDDIPF